MSGLSPQVIFTLFNFEITDTVVSTWVMMAMIIIIAILITRFKPALGELIVEFLTSIIRSVMAEETDITIFLPVLGTLGIFLLFANIFGIFPRMVSPTANINTTIALSIIVFFSVHLYGIIEKGLWGYLKDFANPIFILPLEIVSQFSRTLSLAVRLFGNILSTDLIVAIVFTLIPFIAPLPLAALGMLTGVLQAYIFLVLASLYIASAVEVQETEKERRELKKTIKESSQS
jgi:F-type H+-transporting ATPase subunit a